MLKEGSKAPTFTALDQNGTEHTLSQYKGSWLMLYFYPKDDTPGCTKEACSIRDSWQEFNDKGITVLGVSADTVAKHKKFADKYDLPFPLLADEDKTIIRAYKAWGMKKMYGREYEGIFRITYLISPDGKIAKTYPKVKPDIHADEILRDIDLLQK
jgi:thioredoxin-dependent peroxiredoxin